MLIYEGFLENAKKIASTQPRNSEVNVSVIKKENWEYNITINSTCLSEKYLQNYKICFKKIYGKIFSCFIFKETENKELTDYDYTGEHDINSFHHYDAQMSFDCDLFITIDSIYELICLIYKICKESKDEDYAVYMTIYSYENRKNIIKNLILTGNPLIEENTISNLQLSISNNQTNESFIKLCEVMLNDKKGFMLGRWMSRKGIHMYLGADDDSEILERYEIFVTDIMELIEYAVKSESMSFITGIGIYDMVSLCNSYTIGMEDIKNTYNSLCSENKDVDGHSVLSFDGDIYSLSPISPVIYEGHICYIRIKIKNIRSFGKYIEQKKFRQQNL